MAFLFIIVLLVIVGAFLLYGRGQTGEIEGPVTIKAQGCTDTLRVLHISDAHVSVMSAHEERFHAFSGRMDKAYRLEKHHITKKKTGSAEMFLRLLAEAREDKIDLILLTGDIVNNPSVSSINFICESLRATKIPYLYTAGNHDWHYEGMEGSLDTLRQTWTETALKPLYGGEKGLYYSKIIAGVNFIAIDNSTYQVNQDQLEFYQTQISRQYPTVLLLHIPLFLERDRGSRDIITCGNPDWGWDRDRNHRIEKRERWSQSGNLSSTSEFLEAVKNSSNLIALLAGHTHKAAVDSISASADQYVTGAARFGYSRTFIFKPGT